MNIRPEFFIYLLVMAGVTYLIRALPLFLVRGKVKNRFIRSLLYYIPYTVLAAMTIPTIFYATGNLASGIVAAVVCVVLGFFERGLVTVAIGGAISVLATEWILTLIG